MEIGEVFSESDDDHKQVPNLVIESYPHQSKLKLETVYN